MKNFLLEILNFFLHFVRRLLFFLTQITIIIICQIIYLVTIEPGTGKTVTIRKIRRIRRLTKFKLWLWKNFRWYFEFIHDDKYFINLEEKFGNNKEEKIN